MSRDLIALFVALGVLLFAGGVIWIQIRQSRQQRHEEEASKKEQLRQTHAWLIATIRAIPGFERYCVVRRYELGRYELGTELAVVSIDTGLGYPIPTSLMDCRRAPLDTLVFTHFLRGAALTEAEDFKAYLARSREMGTGLGCNDIEPVEADIVEPIERIPFWERLDKWDL